MTTNPGATIRLVTSALLLLAAACDHDDDDLPPGWDGADACLCCKAATRPAPAQN